MNGDPAVIKALQTALSAEAHLNEQYRLDWRLLKFMGVDKTASKVKGLGSSAHSFRKKVVDRLLFLGGDTDFSIAPIEQLSPVLPIIEHELQLEMAIVSPYEQAIQICMRALDDTSRNLFEHLLKWHEGNVAWLQQQIALIAKIGEVNYITEKM